MSALVAVKGVGPWTADIFLLFCLGHPDAFPAGDLALQEAAKLALGLKTRPDAARLERIAERWRPWRGVAARMLWAYYRAAKAAFRDGPRRWFGLNPARKSSNGALTDERRPGRTAHRPERQAGRLRSWCSCTATARTATI